MTHWMTRTDSTGQPYDTACDCDIGADHTVNGCLVNPANDEKDERR